MIDYVYEYVIIYLLINANICYWPVTRVDHLASAKPWLIPPSSFSFFSFSFVFLSVSVSVCVCVSISGWAGLGREQPVPMTSQ